MKKFAKYLSLVALAAVCVVGVTGCWGGKEKLTEDTGLTGGVAATVNGTEIQEDKVTKSINNMRINAEKESDDDWAEYLNQIGYTPSTLRDNYLDQAIERELVKQFAADEDCAATDEEIQEQVDKVRANYSSDEAWAEALDTAGYDSEDDYRDTLQYSIANKKLTDKFNETAVADDTKLLEQAQSQLNGKGAMKRSSHILFAESDEETARDVLSQLQAGTLDFAEAATEYSTDTGSAEKGGDVGWDGMTSFVEEYQSALDGLQVGQMTDLVKSQYGYHIIKCTDVATVPDEITDISQVPENVMADIRTTVTETQASDDLQAWKDEKRESSDVVINDMPENVPYNVDMSKYETPEEEAATDESGAEDLVQDVEGEANAVDAAEAEADASAEGEAAAQPEAPADEGATDEAAAGEQPEGGDGQ